MSNLRQPGLQARRYSLSSCLNSQSVSAVICWPRYWLSTSVAELAPARPRKKRAEATLSVEYMCAIFRNRFSKLLDISRNRGNQLEGRNHESKGMICLFCPMLSGIPQIALFG